MSTFAYFDENNRRIEVSPQELIRLVNKGVIQRGTIVDVDGKLHKAGSYPSLADRFKKLDDRVEDSFDNGKAHDGDNNADFNSVNDIPAPPFFSVSDDTADPPILPENGYTSESPNESDSNNERVYCPYCGNKAGKVKFCGSCGKLINAGTNGVVDGIKWPRPDYNPFVIGTPFTYNELHYDPVPAKVPNIFQVVPMVLKRVFRFRGRASRVEYWEYFIMSAIFAGVLFLFSFIFLPFCCDKSWQHDHSSYEERLANRETRILEKLKVIKDRSDVSREWSSSRVDDFFEYLDFCKKYNDEPSEYRLKSFAEDFAKDEIGWFKSSLLTKSLVLSVWTCTRLSKLYVLLAILSIVSLTVRRLHDHDISGWFIWIIGIVPVGIVMLLLMLWLPPTNGPNRYGPKPQKLSFNHEHKR